MKETNCIYKIIEVKQKYRKTKKERVAITNPKDFYDFAKKIIGDSDREKFLVAGLNTKNEIMYFDEVHVGSVNASLIDIKLIFKTAILNNAVAIICGHNHPSGSAELSQEDYKISERLHYAGELLDVQFLDHIVVTDEEYQSFKENDISFSEVKDEERFMKEILQHEEW